MSELVDGVGASRVRGVGGLELWGCHLRRGFNPQLLTAMLAASGFRGGRANRATG